MSNTKEWARHCEVLGVGANPTLREVKVAYRRKALGLHPDRVANEGPGGDARAGKEGPGPDQLFAELSRSYSYLLRNFPQVKVREGDPPDLIRLQFRGGARGLPRVLEKLPMALISVVLCFWFSDGRSVPWVPIGVVGFVFCAFSAWALLRGMRALEVAGYEVAERVERQVAEIFTRHSLCVPIVFYGEGDLGGEFACLERGFGSQPDVLLLNREAVETMGDGELAAMLTAEVAKGYFRREGAFAPLLPFVFFVAVNGTLLVGWIVLSPTRAPVLELVAASLALTWLLFRSWRAMRDDTFAMARGAKREDLLAGYEKLHWASKGGVWSRLQTVPISVRRSYLG